jgi:FKBP-type peptidyl-prolyl cis-trans isomerase FklB
MVTIDLKSQRIHMFERNSMKLTLVLALFVFIVGCEGNNTSGSGEMRNSQDSVSYSIGYDIGKNLKGQSIEVTPEVLTRGIKDGQAGTPALNDEQLREVMNAFQQRLATKREETRTAAAEKNKKEGDEFLAKHKAETGVTTTASGLQYKVITMGKGPRPKATQIVRVHYTGTTVDGKEFDSSRKRGEPATFPVNGVIKGWTEALQLMPAGSHWEIVVPPDLAYGENGAGDVIGPNATLIFDVELIEVK